MKTTTIVGLLAALAVAGFVWLNWPPHADIVYPDIMTPAEYSQIVEKREERARLKNEDKEGFWAVKVSMTYLVDAGGTFFNVLTTFSNNEKEALEAGRKWYRESNEYTPVYRVTFEATFCEEYNPSRSEHVELKKRLKNGAIGY